MNDVQSIETLEKTAIRKAGEQNWESAIEYNLQILEQNPKDVPALNRLSKAYKESGDHKKSREASHQVLKIDPNNKVALKNVKGLKTKKISQNIDTSALIKEPGKSVYTDVKITNKSLKTTDFANGQTLKIKLGDKQGSIYTTDNSFVGYVPEELSRKLIKNKLEESSVRVAVVNKKRRNLKILISANKNIFPTEKQNIIPYIRDDEIQEDELDMSTTEEQSDVKVKESILQEEVVDGDGEDEEEDEEI